MEKTFRLICTGLMVLAMGCNFTACSSDDDDENGGGVNGRKMLISEKCNDWRVDYKYDGQGRVIEEIYYQPDESYPGDDIYDKTTYKYETSSITSICHSDRYNYTYTTIYQLNNGRIVKENQDGDITTIEYDGNRIESLKDSYGNIYNVEWDGNNIKRIGNYTYTYSDIDATKGINSYKYIDETLYRQGMYGECSINLMTADGNTNYTYNIGQDGYVCEKTESSAYENRTIIYEWK